MVLLIKIYIQILKVRFHFAIPIYFIMPILFKILNYQIKPNINFKFRKIMASTAAKISLMGVQGVPIVE